jgi:hypothetical protein
MPDCNVRYEAVPELGAESAGELVATATPAAASSSAKVRKMRRFTVTPYPRLAGVCLFSGAYTGCLRTFYGLRKVAPETKLRPSTNKVTPYLVGWGELSEEVREWDREPVRRIPELLAGIGLEIRRRAP